MLEKGLRMVLVNRHLEIGKRYFDLCIYLSMYLCSVYMFCSFVTTDHKGKLFLVVYIAIQWLISQIDESLCTCHS